MNQTDPCTPSRRIRIFVDGHVFDRGFEGAGSFISGIYRALLQEYPERYTLILGCNEPKRATEFFRGISGVEYYEYGFSNRYLRLLVDVPRAVSRSAADFAHFQYFTPVIKNCPWIVTIHDVLFNDFPQYFPAGYSRLRNLLFPISARRADILTTVSGYSRGRISYWYGIPPSCIHVVPNGVKPSEVSNGHIDIEGDYLLCVSRFEPRKNQALLLEAYLKGEFWKRGISIVFVGARSLPVAKFDRLLEKMPAEARRRVILLSGISESELTRLYQGALASVYPSLAEGFGIPPVEAAILGTPSLCARNTAMTDFNFLDEFMFDAGDPDNLLGRLTWVLDHRDDARRLALGHSRQALEEYTWPRAAHALHRLIEGRIRTAAS